MMQFPLKFMLFFFVLRLFHVLLLHYCHLRGFSNKVDVQNNILHTLREASHGGEKAIFHFSFPVPHPPLGLFGLLKFQKKFLVLKLVPTQPRGLIWYVKTLYYTEVIFSQFFQWSGWEVKFQNGISKSFYLEI